MPWSTNQLCFFHLCSEVESGYGILSNKDTRCWTQNTLSRLEMLYLEIHCHFSVVNKSWSEVWNISDKEWQGTRGGSKTADFSVTLTPWDKLTYNLRNCQGLQGKKLFLIVLLRIPFVLTSAFGRAVLYGNVSTLNYKTLLQFFKVFVFQKICLTKLKYRNYSKLPVITK